MFAENKQPHLLVRMSVSESLACIKHKPVKLKRHNETFKAPPRPERERRTRSVTWEHEDEAGRQSSDQRDDAADVWDEESEDEGDDEPHQCLQDPPPSLTANTHLHLLALETQPQALYHCPAGARHRRTERG